MIAFLVLALATVHTSWADSVHLHMTGPTGAYHSAVGLGGLSRSPSSDMMFYNPAALSDILNSDASLSMNRVPDELDPTLSVAARFSKLTAVGIGYRPTYPLGRRENQFYIASAFAPTPILWPGANVKYLSGTGKLGLDLDLGLVYNPFPWLRLGTTVENVFGSTLDADQKIHRDRIVSVATQYFWNQYAVDGVNAFVRSGMARHHYTVGGGLEKRFMLNPQVGLRVGGYHESLDSTASGMTLGFIYIHNIKEQTMTVEYAYQTEQQTQHTRHYISLHFGLYGGRDRRPPEIFAEANRGYLTPDGDGVDDIVYFRLKAVDNLGGAGLKSWALVIMTVSESNQATQIKAFAGGGLPPSTISWDGRNSQGVLTAPGRYYYQFMAKDKNGNQTQTDQIPIQVK